MIAPFSDPHAKIIKDILSQYPYPFFVFGSRVKGTHKEFSDLDLCYRVDIPDSVLANLLNDFEQSDLPFKVDIIAWNRCSPEFQKHIENDLMPVEKLWHLK
jgi:predicted nucleotidyltransferase